MVTFTLQQANIDTYRAAHINDAYNAIMRQRTIPDAFIEPGGAGYIAFDPGGGVLSDNVALSTVFVAVATAGKHVHFRPGSYAADTTLSVLDDVIVSGHGVKTIITKATSGGLFRVVGIAADFVKDARISYLKLVGPSVAATQVAGSGVLVEYGERIELDHLEINGFGSLGDDSAIEMDTCRRIKVHHNRCFGSKNDILTGSPTSTTIRVTDSEIMDNECHENFDDGIHLQRGSHNKVMGNLCWGQPAGGSADGAGIDTLGEEYSQVIGNICRDNNRGMEIGNTANQSYADTGNVFSGNVIEGNGIYGMTIIASAKKNIISNNEICNNGTDGIRFGSATSTSTIEDNVLHHNQIWGNPNYGIDLFGYNVRACLDTNYLSGNGVRDINIRVSTGSPTAYALIDNKTLSAVGISDAVNDAGKVLRLFGA